MERHSGAIPHPAFYRYGPFPASALQTLQQLSDSSDGRMLVLVADKGFAHEEDLVLAPREPCWTFMPAADVFPSSLTLTRLANTFAAKGGEALVPPKHFTSLNLCAFIQRNPGDEFPATHKAYQQALSGIWPRRSVCHDELVEFLP